MSWQEDLQRLESELATGRISAEDYRTQRDALLAAANPAQPSPAQPGTPPGGTQAPASQPQQAAPFPPAFTWSAKRPDDERTQTIRPAGSDSSAEKTQVVSGNPDLDQRTETLRPSDPERTQVVQNPYAQQRPQQSPSWPGADQSNLYSNETMPANVPHWTPAGAFGDWPKQGPEVFSARSGGHRGRRILLIVVLVLVLAGLAVGGWLLFGRNGSAGATGTATTAASPSPPAPPGPRAAIGLLVAPAGFPSAQAFTPTELQQVKPLPQPDLDILRSTSLSNADYVVSKDGGTTLDLWSFETSDNAAAKALATSFNTDQTRFGFQATDIHIANGRYLAYQSKQQSGGHTVTAYRLHYVVGDQVIRVEAFDPDPARARSEFMTLLRMQTKLTPADG